MIGVCIFSIGILAVCTMQISGLNGNMTARRYTEGGTIAMEQMEILRAMPYSNLPADSLNDAGAGLFSTDNTADQVAQDGVYTIYTNVAPNYLEPNTTTVSVIVVWNSRGMQRTVALQGLIPQTS
jgi:Tfp pilus assembly protein PilV